MQLRTSKDPPVLIMGFERNPAITRFRNYGLNDFRLPSGSVHLSFPEAEVHHNFAGLCLRE